MSRRDHTRMRRDALTGEGMRRPRGGPPGPDRRGPDDQDQTRFFDRMTLTLLPLRVFLGVTFVYAGVDKLIDPAFLRAAGAGSIGSQLAEFGKVSPIAPLVELVGQTFPVEIGLLIAVAEIAIGLGALSGLLFRASAAGGLALSVLFWLTASWATKPYYYGPDLPYAFGWLSLALTGTGGRFTIETLLGRALDRGAYDEPLSDERRMVLKAGLLGVAAVAVTGLAGTVGAAIFGHAKMDIATFAPLSGPIGSASSQTLPPLPITPVPSLAGAVAPGARPTSTTAPGMLVASVSQLASGRTVTFVDPITGDPGIVLKLADGSIVAFDAVCTHAGCTVEYDPSYRLLVCPCHGAAFDPSHGAQVVEGPTNQPLAAIPIHVDPTSGRITLSA